MRPESTFVIADVPYPVRPTFLIVQRVENRFGAIPSVLQRIRSGNFGMGDTSEIVQLILGSPKAGGPKAEDVDATIFDGYMEYMTKVGEFLMNSVTDPGATPRPLGKPLTQD